MASRRSRDRSLSCLGKATYRTESEAWDAIREYERRVVWPRTMTPYKCRLGKHFHKGELRQRVPHSALLTSLALQLTQNMARAGS